MSIFSQQNRYFNVEAYYSMSFDNFNMQQHKHNSCEIMYVIKDCCTIKIRNSNISLRQGQFIFIDQNVPHALCIKEDVSCSVINLEFSCSPKDIGIDGKELASEFKPFASFLQHPLDYIVLYDNENLCHALKDLLLELESSRFDKNNYVIKILFMHMLIELSRCSENDSTYSGLTYVRDAQQYIKDNLDNEFDIQSIADYVGIHKTYLQKLFKQYQNCSISEFRNRLKLQKAAYMLQNTAASVIDIAFEAGYNSRQHFSYTFEKYYGISPRQYRQRNSLYKDIDTKEMKLLEGNDYKNYVNADEYV